MTARVFKNKFVIISKKKFVSGHPFLNFSKNKGFLFKFTCFVFSQRRYTHHLQEKKMLKYLLLMSRRECVEQRCRNEKHQGSQQISSIFIQLSSGCHQDECQIALFLFQLSAHVSQANHLAYVSNFLSLLLQTILKPAHFEISSSHTMLHLLIGISKLCL